MNILLTLILLSNVAILVIFLVMFLKMKHVSEVVNEKIEEFRIFVTQPDDKSPSPLAQTVDSMAVLFSRALVAQIKTSLMGTESGLVRGEQAVVSSLGEDLLHINNPLISGILDRFPKVKKTLLKNPALLDIALSKIGSLGKTGAPVPAGDNGHSQMNFKL